MGMYLTNGLLRSLSILSLRSVISFSLQLTPVNLSQKPKIQDTLSLVKKITGSLTLCSFNYRRNYGNCF